MEREINKEMIEKEAKQILDKFAKALEKVEKEHEADSWVEREDFERKEKASLSDESNENFAVLQNSQKSPLKIHSENAKMMNYREFRSPVVNSLSAQLQKSNCPYLKSSNKNSENPACSADIDFKENMLKNAPAHDDDFVIAEKGSWK